jgi:hypothetical protein
MTKAKAKLSWALERELEVRKALGGRGSNWTKGRRGAQLAATTLAARTAADLQRKNGAVGTNGVNGVRTRRGGRPICDTRRQTVWRDVPQHVQALVLSHVSLADLEALRLAGFGGVDADWREQLRNIFVARRDELHQVLTLFVQPKHLPPRGQDGTRVGTGALRDVSDRFGPVVFSNFDRLVLHARAVERRDRLEVAGQGSGGGGGEQAVTSGALPGGIAEMRRLRSLEVLPNIRMTSLPTNLSFCADMRVLILAGHDFVVLPPVVLRLRQLRNLSLAQNRRLTALPQTLGDALPNLSHLDIRGCVGLRSLPVSALRRLDAVARTTTRRSPLLLTQDMFSLEDLEKAFVDSNCPLLRALLRSNSLMAED